MSLSAEERTIVVNLEIEKAKTMLEQTAMSVEHKMWDLTANRLYYGAFHAVCALLIHNGIQVGTHKGAQIMLNKEFVQKGIISQEESHLYARLQQLREEGDYNCCIKTTEEEIRPYINATNAFIAKIEKLIFDESK